MIKETIFNASVGTAFNYGFQVFTNKSERVKLQANIPHILEKYLWLEFYKKYEITNLNIDFQALIDYVVNGVEDINQYIFCLETDTKIRLLNIFKNKGMYSAKAKSAEEKETVGRLVDNSIRIVYEYYIDNLIDLSQNLKIQILKDTIAKNDINRSQEIKGIEKSVTELNYKFEKYEQELDRRANKIMESLKFDFEYRDRRNNDFILNLLNDKTEKIITAFRDEITPIKDSIDALHELRKKESYYNESTMKPKEFNVELKSFTPFEPVDEIQEERLLLKDKIEKTLFELVNNAGYGVSILESTFFRGVLSNLRPSIDDMYIRILLSIAITEMKIYIRLKANFTKNSESFSVFKDELAREMSDEYQPIDIELAKIVVESVAKFIFDETEQKNEM